MIEKIIKGITVYDYDGAGEPLVFIHAFPLSSEMWEHQVIFFKDKFRVITYDVRGLGKSKQNNNQFTLEEYVDDLFYIVTELNLKKINVCGLSMGGYIILRALEKYPDIFSSVILADTRAEKDTDEGLILRSKAIIDIKSGKLDEVLTDYLKKLLSEKNYNNSELRAYVHNMMRRNTAEGIIGAMLAIATRTTTLHSLKDIKISTLILVGEYDTLTPIKYAEDMKNSFPSSTLKIVPNAGHLSNIENPNYFNESILEFLENFKA